MNRYERMTNEEIVKLFQETGSEKALERICKNNNGLLHSIVRSFKPVYAAECSIREPVISSGDILQDGYIGLIRAVKEYDPERGASFSSVAAIYIRGEIMRGLSDRGHAIRLPVYKREQITRLKKVRQAYLSVFGRMPNIEEIGAYIGISRKEVEELLKLEILAKVTSIEKQLSEDPEDGALCDIIPDSKNQIEEAEESIFKDQVKEKLWGEVDKLGANQAAILHGYYQESKSINEIRKSLNITRQKAFQTKEKALENLKKGKTGRELKELAKGYCIADGASYTGVSVGIFRRTGTSATERAALMRIEAAKKAGEHVRQRKRFERAGINRKEREQYYKMLIDEKRKAEQKRIERLKAEF